MQGESLWLHLPIIKELAAMCHKVFVGGSVSYAYTTIPTYPRCTTASITPLCFHWRQRSSVDVVLCSVGTRLPCSATSWQSRLSVPRCIGMTGGYSYSCVGHVRGSAAWLDRPVVTGLAT